MTCPARKARTCNSPCQTHGPRRTRQTVGPLAVGGAGTAHTVGGSARSGMALTTRAIERIVCRSGRAAIIPASHPPTRRAPHCPSELICASRCGLTHPPHGRPTAAPPYTQMQAPRARCQVHASVPKRSDCAVR
eukprot:4773321-Prymnesium_polylepis.2